MYIYIYIYILKTTIGIHIVCDPQKNTLYAHQKNIRKTS